MRSIDGESQETLRLHPRPGSPRFIPRLGYGQQRLGSILAAEGVTITVSPLYYLDHNPQLALFTSRDPPLGLVLDPATHLRQVAHEVRAPAFRALPFGSAIRFDPNTSRLSDREYELLVTAPLEFARARGATLFLSGYHLSGRAGTRGRALDLAIARDSIAHFAAQRMDEPPELGAVPIRRELYVVIAVDAELLESARERRRLAESYLELEASGYWVKIAGFDERARRSLIRASAAFLALLAKEHGVVVSDGAGHLHVGLLANGVSTSIGLAESERFRLPQNRPRDDWSHGRARTLYHEKFLRSYRGGGIAAARAFAGASCLCGRHASDAPPTGREIGEHAAVVRAREARDALSGSIAERREWLLAKSAMASDRAHDVGVDHTPPIVFEALLDGIDSIDTDELEETG